MAAWDRTLAALDNRGRAVVTGSVVLVAAIAVTDWQIEPNISLGFLYVIPILLASTALDRLGILIMAAASSILRELFSPFHNDPGAPARLTLVFAVFAVAGVLASEMTRNRRLVLARMEDRQRHIALQQETADQMRVLIETSPLGIVVAGSNGKILLANAAAAELVGNPAIEGEDVRMYLPALASVLAGTSCSLGMRTEIECRGHKKDGQVFLAHVWLSVDGSEASPRIAAMIWDASDELRFRQSAELRSLLSTSRVLVASFAHEVRNLSTAAVSLHKKIAALSDIAADGDFAALGEVLHSIEHIAASGLRFSTPTMVGAVNLTAVMDQARVLIEPLLQEADVRLHWNVPERLPPVMGDQTSLLQVFLNLAANTRTALARKPQGVLHVTASTERARVLIRFADSGPGVRHPDQLFRPFAPSAEQTGIGLYISRGMLRAFGGDLVHEPSHSGACFVVELQQAPARQGTTS